MIDDIVGTPEDSIREPVLAQEAPDVFGRIELRRARHQGWEGDVLGYLKFWGGVPSGAIEDEDGIDTGSEHLGDLFQMHLHGSCNANGQNPSRAPVPARHDHALDPQPRNTLNKVTILWNGFSIIK